MIEVNYLDGGEGQIKPVQPNVPDAPQSSIPSPPSKIPPPPAASGAGAAWFVCGNEGVCSHVGYVATGSDEPVKKVKWGRCKECRGLGATQLGGGVDFCEECQGKGKVVISEWEEEASNLCPWCGHQMVFMQKGGFPVGYPRMETPHSEEDQGFGGNVAFGRNRIVS